MLTAKEASSLYDEMLETAENYIEKEIEPAIKNTASRSKSCDFKIGDAYYQGIYFSFIKGKNNAVSITKKIIQILEDNGYTVNTTVHTTGNEYRDGNGTLTISWTV